MAKAGIETLMSCDTSRSFVDSTDAHNTSASQTQCSPLHGLTIDDPIMCSICFESGSKDGPHRLVSLKCGHLFGQSCIKQWMETKKKCPTCDKWIGKSDMRQLFIHCSGQRITSRIQSLIHSMNSEIGSHKSLILKLQQENEDLVLQKQRLVILSHGIDVRVTYDPVTLNVFSRTQDVFQVMVKQALFSLKYQVSLRTGIPVTELEFFYRTHPIGDKDTPDQWNMQSHDVICVTRKTPPDHQTHVVQIIRHTNQ